MKRLLGIIFWVMVIGGCAKTDVETPDNSQFVSGSGIIPGPQDMCGKITKKDILNHEGETIGYVQFANDNVNLYVSAIAFNGLNLHSIYVHFNDAIQRNGDGSVDFNSFAVRYSNLENISYYTIAIPLSNLNDCNPIYPFVKLKNKAGHISEYWVDGGLMTPIKELYSFNYCRQFCNSVGCNIETGQFKTYGMGAYGQEAKGNNPSAYLKTNFVSTFPAGIEIGCTNTISFSSFEEVNSFLPQAGIPESINASVVAPDKTLKNTLAGQVLTLHINCTLDEKHKDFASSSEHLKDLKIASGIFAGKSVAYVLNKGNEVLGGCASDCTPAQINEVITKINENFLEGNVNKGYLVCP